MQTSGQQNFFNNYSLQLLSSHTHLSSPHNMEHVDIFILISLFDNKLYQNVRDYINFQDGSSTC